MSTPPIPQALLDRVRSMLPEIDQVITILEQANRRRHDLSEGEAERVRELLDDVRMKLEKVLEELFTRRTSRQLDGEIDSMMSDLDRAAQDLMKNLPPPLTE